MPGHEHVILQHALQMWSDSAMFVGFSARYGSLLLYKDRTMLPSENSMLTAAYTEELKCISAKFCCHLDCRCVKTQTQNNGTVLGTGMSAAAAALQQ